MRNCTEKQGAVNNFRFIVSHKMGDYSLHLGQSHSFSSYQMATRRRRKFHRI